MMELILATAVIVTAAIAVRLQHLEVAKYRRRAYRAQDRLADERIRREIAEARVVQLLDELDQQVDLLTAQAAARHPSRRLSVVKGQP